MEDDGRERKGEDGRFYMSPPAVELIRQIERRAIGEFILFYFRFPMRGDFYPFELSRISDSCSKLDAQDPILCTVPRI